MSRLTLALDVMGGDIGPRITIPASLKALEKDPMLSLLLFGNAAQISPFLSSASPVLKQRLTVCHCTSMIENNQNIVYALRHSKGTSMRLAIEAVQQGLAQGCVSAGNTAALLGLSKVILQPLKGIQRPALISTLPTITGEHSIMLDLGANVECSAENLHQFALMGAIFAENTLGLVFPRIGLLNIGIEDIKGYKSIREAAELMKQDNQLNYVGFIEGDKLLNGNVDVIISDGFAGNVALKTLEGTVKNLLHLFKQQTPKLPEFLPDNIRHWLMKKLFNQSGDLYKMAPERYNGASFIGLNSVVVKSHGSASIEAFTYAILDATNQIRQQIPNKILASLNKR